MKQLLIILIVTVLVSCKNGYYEKINIDTLVEVAPGLYLAPINAWKYKCLKVGDSLVLGGGLTITKLK